MTNIKQIQNLKKKYLTDRKKFKKELEPQHGISVFIEYDYLLNTDIDWIIREIRSSIIKPIKSETEKEKRLVLTFDIDQIKTENSIELILTPGLIDPYIANYLIGVAGSLTAALVYQGFRHLRQKRLKKRTRPNIKYVRVKKVIIRGDRIEYSEDEEESFEIED